MAVRMDQVAPIATDGGDQFGEWLHLPRQRTPCVLGLPVLLNLTPNYDNSDENFCGETLDISGHREGLEKELGKRRECHRATACLHSLTAITAVVAVGDGHDSHLTAGHNVLQ